MYFPIGEAIPAGVWGALLAALLAVLLAALLEVNRADYHADPLPPQSRS